MQEADPCEPATSSLQDCCREGRGWGLREPCEWGGPRGEAGLEPVFPTPHLWGSSWSWSPSPSSHPACGSPLCDALRVAGGRDTHTPTQPGVHGCRPHTAERPSRPGSVTTGHPLPGGHRPSSAWGLGLGPPPPACRRRRWTVCVASCGRHLEQRGGRADPVTQRRSRPCFISGNSSKSSIYGASCSWLPTFARKLTKPLPRLWVQEVDAREVLGFVGMKAGAGSTNPLTHTRP